MDQRTLLREIFPYGGKLEWTTKFGACISFVKSSVRDIDLWEMPMTLKWAVHLDFSDTQISSGATSALSQARRLESIDLDGTCWKADSLILLKKLPKLVQIRAGDTGITSTDVASFRRHGWGISIDVHRWGPFSPWFPGFRPDKKAPQ